MYKRQIHAIKGACGFLGFKKLESVAHVGENLLTKLRDGELMLRPEMTTALLQMVDAIRRMLEQIDATGTEGARNDGALIGTLMALLKGEHEAPASRPVVPPAAVVPAPEDEGESHRAFDRRTIDQRRRGDCRGCGFGGADTARWRSTPPG